MIKCPVCGAENEENSEVCTQCNHNMKIQGDPSPALALLGQRTGSWMFRLAVGLYTMMVVYNIASIVLNVSFIDNYIVGAEKTLEEILSLQPGVLSPLAAAIGGMGAFVVVLILLPEILQWLGMGMFLLSARSLKEPSRETGGLSLLQVSAVIEAVFYLAAVLLVFFIFFMGMFREAQAGQLKLANGVVYGSLLAVTASVGALVLAYEIKMIRTVQSIKNTMKTGLPDSRISLYVIVVNFIMSALVLMTAIMTVRYTGIEGFIASAAGTTVTLLVTFGLLLYRNRMKRLEPRNGAS